MLKRSKMAAFLVAALGISGVSFASDKANNSNLFSEKELQTAAKIRDAALKDNLSYKILESLTTEVGPRMAGTPADARAVAWAEAKFKELGFDKIWKEPVTFPSWKRGVEKAEILTPFPQPLLITALGNSIATPVNGLSAEVVQFATYKDLVAAAPEMVRGKIVFINHKMQTAQDYGKVQPGRSKGASEAARKGAVAIVIRSVGTDSHRFPHTGVMNYEPDAAKIPAAAMSNSDADLLTRMMMRGAPVTLKLELGSSAGEMLTSYNVIGEMTGTELPNEYVVIGGHLDSWDLGTGTIDDGAGCAMTMAAAESIKRMGVKPRRSVRVVLFANEEQGLFGGKAYAKAHQDQLGQIQAAAEADSGQGPVIQLSSYVLPQALLAVKQMQTVMAPLGVQAGDNDAYPGPDMGDLKMAGAASFGLNLKSDDYFDYHHTPDDTFDKIEPARINQATAAYAVFAWMAAQAPMSFGSGSPALKGKKAEH
ncbi:MAG: M20/M25/M40 family metallo-hydrolase [Undibacterium sp.]|nr:M20/M25/M40 family metallo-hydrolase [Undibacterium sp.]